MITTLLLTIYFLVTLGIAIHTVADCHLERDKPFYRPNSSAGMRRLRVILWPIAMFMP